MNATLTTDVPATRPCGAEAPLALRTLGLILSQLTMLCILGWQLHIEEQRHLPSALVLGTLGFLVHALLPARYRRVWFAIMTGVATVLVLGWTQAAGVLGCAALLIGVAIAPLPWLFRVAIVVVLVAFGVAWRKNSVAPFWTILGSLFMFRMLVFLQTIRRERQPTRLLDAVSYFCLWPNAFFPLFPVVDYETFRSSYYNAQRERIYQTGIHWLATGLLHLMAYRFIKYELLITPLEIRTLTDLAQFLAANYALYVRISGQFHIVCGLLHLFGYHLPRTHAAYFLASSFSDIWRRINIYWKVFMEKSFFYPAFFWSRGGGQVTGILVAVVWVFLWTWIGHSWQAFWLTGDFALRQQDLLLWLGVGGLMAVSGVLDYVRARQPAVHGFQFIRATRHSMQVIGVFACVSVFWAQWSNPGVVKLLLYSSSLIDVGSRDVLVLGGGVLAAVAIGVSWQYALGGRLGLATARPWTFESSASAHVIPLFAALLIMQPTVYGFLPRELAQIAARLQLERSSPGEALAQIAGYYEELNNQSLQASPFLGQTSPPRRSQAIDFSDLIRNRRDLLGHELIPHWQGTWLGAPITINRWGLRDVDRELVKPPDTTRIAVVGTSVVMGYGVADDQTFAQILEMRLNARSEGLNRRFEVLNFGVGRYSPLHRRLQIEHKALAFQPNLIVYCAHQDEIYTSAGNLAPAVSEQIDLEDPCLSALVRSAGIRADTSDAMTRIILERHHVEILQCIYRGIAAAAGKAQAEAWHVYLPIPDDHVLNFDPRMTATIAAEAGLNTVDLTDWYAPYAAADVMLSSSEHHPNALGHRLIADALESKIVVRYRLPNAREK